MARQPYYTTYFGPINLLGGQAPRKSTEFIRRPETIKKGL